MLLSARYRSTSNGKQLVSEYKVVLPETVVAELEEIAAYDDNQARGARTALDWTDDVPTERVRDWL